MARKADKALTALRPVVARALSLAPLRSAAFEERCSPSLFRLGFASFALRQNAEQLGIQLATPASQRTARMREVENKVPENRWYTSKIKHLGKDGKWEEALEVFRSASQKDTILYTTLMTAAHWCGRFRDGIRLYDDMRAESLEPSAFTFVTLMNLHSRVGQHEEVRRYFKELVALEGRPPPLAFMPLLTSASDAGNIAAVEEIFVEMESYGVRPDRGHFGAKLMACRSAGDPARALAVLNEMKARGMFLDVRAYTITLGALRASGLATTDFAQTQKLVANLVADMDQQRVEKHEYFVEEHVGALLGCPFHEAEQRARTGELPAAVSNAALEVINEATSSGLRMTRGLRTIHDALRRQQESQSARIAPTSTASTLSSTEQAAFDALAHPWKELWSEEHKLPYYWNTATGDTTWLRPAP